jgi:16S rRNA (cytosine967-C5)-methyltransferase
LLRLALYQMFWLERVPSYAAVNESVEICKQRGFGGQAKFINAVLRAYSRESEGTREKLARFKKEDISLGYSHPAWLCRRWEERFGDEKAKKLLEWNNTPPQVYARVNRLKRSAESLRAEWTKEGVEFRAVEFDWIAAGSIYLLAKYPPLSNLDSFKAGGFYVQDPSTLLAPAMLKPESGEEILDYCAAPGGKTAFIADLIQNRGRILARDIEPKRLKLVAENARRLGAEAITIDPSSFPKESSFDRVLVDAPCSNSGVTRRRVELRWRISSEEITRLVREQVKLLQQAARKTRPGGTLVYSTCSLEREENEAVVREFLASNPSFKLAAERQLTPMADGVDGAYSARLEHEPQA